MSEIKVTKDLEQKKLIVEFMVNESKDKVWQAYTNKDMFEKWWGPEGWVTTTKEFNVTPNGKIHYGMKCVDESQGDWFGQTSWGVMEIIEVETGNSFAYIDYFSDEAGVLNRELPALKVTNEFIEEEKGTKVICTSFADRSEQIEQLLEMGMIEGFTSQLNKLDKLFA